MRCEYNRIAMAGLIGMGLIPIACHRHVPVQTDPGVGPSVRDTAHLVAIGDTGVVAFFRDTAPTVVFSVKGQTFNLQISAERESLRAMIRKERELWRSAKPRDYRFLLRVDCFCPGPRGWQLIEVRSGQPLRAWDRNGRSAALTDWNTISIDALYDNLERAAANDGEMQIAFDPRWHFPAYTRTNAARVPDSWSIIEARGLRPLQ